MMDPEHFMQPVPSCPQCGHDDEDGWAEAWEDNDKAGYEDTYEVVCPGCKLKYWVRPVVMFTMDKKE